MTVREIFNTYTLAELITMRESLWNDTDARGQLRDPEMFYRVGIAINWKQATQ